MIAKKFFLSVSALVGTLTCSDASEKPNILFIFSDDQSFETVRAHGYTDIDTPNLDRLAREGVSFTKAYNMGAWAGAVCTASRTCLNTGSFVWRAKEALKTCKDGDRLTWSQMMSEQGYDTYMSGKWHVGISVPDIFEYTGTVQRGGMPRQTREGYNRPLDEADYAAGWKPWETEREGYWKGGKHWSEVLADEGVEFLQEASQKDAPFFMYLAFNAPHDPRQAPKEYVDRYPLERIKVPKNFLKEYPLAEEICGKTLRDERLMPYPRTEYAVKVNRQEYYASITHMDVQVGRILEALNKSGKQDNTWIIFTSDHGLAVGQHGFAGKQNMYEHSVRAPFIIWGPGVAAGKKIKTPIYIQDAMATALELSGQAIPEFVDYKSVLPLMDGRRKSNYDHIYGAYIGTQRMILLDDWKLIAYPEVNTKKLFNLAADPFEMKDLASKPRCAKKVAKLSALLEMTMDEMADPMTSLAAADYPKSTKQKKKKKKKKDLDH